VQTGELDKKLKSSQANREKISENLKIDLRIPYSDMDDSYHLFIVN